MKNRMVIALLVLAATIAWSENTTLRFGLFLQGYEGIAMEDVYSKCLENNISHFEVGVSLNQPFVPGNYLWASVDSVVASAYNAGLESEINPDLCLSVGLVDMPGWCWAIEYGQVGVSDPKDMSTFENFDVLAECYGLLAERYRTGGILSQREGWIGWGVSRYNPLGESDLSWHPSGYNPLFNPEYYKITPSEMRLPELAATYKQIRQAIRLFDPSAEVALSFMCQPYQESWPYDTTYPTGLGVGEFEEYMTLLYQEFSSNEGYDKYPDLIDWHGYPHFNDPLRFGSDGLWVESLPDDYCWWFENVSLSQRAIHHDMILDDFGYEGCQLVVLESGASPLWYEVKPAYRTGENLIRGHISFMLSTLAEMSASNRTALLQFDTDIDNVTARYVPAGYSMRDWWNDSEESIDTVFLAYSRMVTLLTGKVFLEKYELSVLDERSQQTAVVHSYNNPETANRVYQIRTSLPTVPPEKYTVRIPVNTRYVNIVPSIGDVVYEHDCGMFYPYAVILDIDWMPLWIEELSSRSESDQSKSFCLSLSANSENPVTGSSISINISAEHSAQQSSISVFDLSGRIVDSLEFETDEKGLAVCNWFTENVPSGIYLLRETSGNSDVLGITVLK